MKEIVLMYARYTRRANDSAFTLMDALSEEALNEDRKGYYGSLASMASHVIGATLYFHRLFRVSCPAAAGILNVTEHLKTPHDAHVTPEEWKALREISATADRATVTLFESAGEAELSCPVKLDWYHGDPESVPLYFLAHQLFTHGIHHRGQISQVLDQMGVKHDFSGIDLAFLPGR